MIIQDLMINDLVLYKGHVKKVVGIKRAYNQIDLAINDKDFFTCSVTDIEPIPLTPEILKADGFQEYPQVYSKHVRKDGHLVSATILKDKNENIYINGVGHIVYLHYVHELQHILRLCGLNDLADNQKIK